LAQIGYDTANEGSVTTGSLVPWRVFTGPGRNGSMSRKSALDLWCWYRAGANWTG